MNVTVCDVGPRDGLQNDPTHLAPSVRADLCRRLAACGLPRVEAVSFVNPTRVPQMAGAEEVVAALPKNGTVFSGLVLNERGYDRAIDAGLKNIDYAFAATDAFNARNQNTTVEQAMAAAERLCKRAKRDGVCLAVGFAVAFGCPFEGPVSAQRVIELGERLAAFGPAEISVADTIGVAVPAQVRAIVGHLARGPIPISAHFHNTRNTGFANALAAVEAGANALDASVGGVGGCPFAPKATGNIATEDLVYLLHGMGYRTGIDLDALIGCANWLAGQLGHDIPGAVRKAGNFPKAS